MEEGKKIPVPKDDDAVSSLAGISMIGIDTDPDANLVMTLNAYTGEQTVVKSYVDAEVLAVIPIHFHGTRRGYLVVVYDHHQDPLYEERKHGS